MTTPESVKNFSAWVANEPFVLATGIAAWVHSTWTFTVTFSGEPETWEGWIVYGIPAALLALAIDIGQIRTASDISKGKKNAGKIVTFVALAFATWYLQFFYMVSHVPALALGAGIRAEWVSVVTFMRDSSIFIIPALLPIATTLHTFGNAALPTGRRRKTQANAKRKRWNWRIWERRQMDASESQANARTQPERKAIPLANVKRIAEPQTAASESLLWKCDTCKPNGDPQKYASERSVTNARVAHESGAPHKAKMAELAAEIEPVMNGNGANQ